MHQRASGATASYSGEAMTPIRRHCTLISVLESVNLSCKRRIALSEIEIEASRALIWKCAWALDRGERAGRESSIAKAYVSEAVNRIVDRAAQICGGMGVSGDLPIARIADEVRPFRIYDGATETHLWSIARRAVRERESVRAGSTTR